MYNLSRKLPMVARFALLMDTMPHRLMAIRQEMEYLNTIGKRFVAAIDRFQVHRALLAALQELYSFSACCILLKGDPFELFIIPCYPLDASFLGSMIQHIANAANRLNFPHMTPAQLARSAYFDAPDELAQTRTEGDIARVEDRLVLEYSPYS